MKKKNKMDIIAVRLLDQTKHRETLRQYKSEDCFL